MGEPLRGVGVGVCDALFNQLGLSHVIHVGYRVDDDLFRRLSALMGHPQHQFFLLASCSTVIA